MMPNNTEWNRELIQQVLPHEEVRILSLKPSKTGIPDKLIWLRSKFGDYTTKNIGSSLTCKYCNQDESINHLLIHCDFAYNVWRLAPFSSCIDSIGLLDLSTAWLSLCKLTCLPPVGIASGPLTPWILWSLWLARNNRVFNNKDTTPEEVITKATAAAQEWLKEQRREDTPMINPTKQRHPRPANSIKLHTDASWRADLRLAGLGWTLEKENQISSFTVYCHFVNSSLVAEGLALRETPTCCIAKGTRCVLCKSDSLQLIRALTEESPI
ncbi:hypothetical protein N665_0925s0007 [Sinapis alba]|nr:hypothetical protein N665_0925s0007 [Sinapis alba]